MLGHDPKSKTGTTGTYNIVGFVLIAVPVVVLFVSNVYVTILTETFNTIWLLNKLSKK